MTIAGLHESVIDYANRVHDLQSPSDVLNGLHDITKMLPLPVLGAARFQPKAGGWDSVQLGKSLFLHTGVPKGWWEEYQTLGRGKFRPLLSVAQSRMAPSTWAEAKQIVKPIGIDRWSDELFAKYGIRDGLACPVGGRWVVVFWSRKDLSDLLGITLGATNPPGFGAYRATSLADASRNRRLAFDLHRCTTPRSGKGTRDR